MKRKFLFLPIILTALVVCLHYFSCDYNFIKQYGHYLTGYACPSSQPGEPAPNCVCWVNN